MTLENTLQQIIKHLSQTSCQYALAGALAATIYRQDARATNDIDLLLMAGQKTQQEAKKLIMQFDLQVTVIRKASLEGGPLFAIKQKSTEPYILAGRKKEGNTPVGIDVILPAMPWFPLALERAQSNCIDFGFAAIPCLTVEDVILSKIYSFGNNHHRFKDLDDLKSIFEANHPLDQNYLRAQIKNLGFKMPKEILAFVPETLKKVL